MDFKLYTLSSFIGNGIAILMGVLLIIAPILIPKIVSNIKKTSPIWDRSPESVIPIAASVVIGTLSALICAICLISDTIGVIENHSNESTYYNYVVAEGESLRNQLAASDDLVNDSLRIKIVEYNSNLTFIKNARTNSIYWINFSGACDWDSLYPIMIKVPAC